MGTVAEEPRIRRITVRFTDKEYIQLRQQMENVDCLSAAKYLRARALNQTIQIRRDIRYSDRELRNQINRFSATVARIGVDYNQATKLLHTLSRKTRPDGSPVINARAVNYYLSKIYTMTKALCSSVDKLIDYIEQHDRSASQGEECDNT